MVFPRGLARFFSRELSPPTTDDDRTPFERFTEFTRKLLNISKTTWRAKRRSRSASGATRSTRKK